MIQSSTYFPISLFGTGSGVQMYYLVLAGLYLVVYGTERILLSAVFGLLAAALIVASEALVPRDTGLYPPAWGFGSFVAVSLAATTFLMATVYHALRTAERAEEALARDNEIIQEKTRQLEVANTYKSHFLASASHDLRQPLHALNLFVAQLQSESDPVERQRLVTRIDTAVESMNELFEALLDMTKGAVHQTRARSIKSVQLQAGPAAPAPDPAFLVGERDTKLQGVANTMLQLLRSQSGTLSAASVCQVRGYNCLWRTCASGRQREPRLGSNVRPAPQGCHGFGTDNRQVASFTALGYTFLREKIGFHDS